MNDEVIKKDKEEEAPNPTCYDCDNEIESEDTSYEFNYNTICETCYNDNYFTCSNCNEIANNDDSSSYEDELYCRACFNDNFDTCFSCSNTIRNDDASYVQGEYICENCYSDNCYSCSNCDDSMFSENAHYCESCEADYCNSCWDEHSCNNGVLSDFQFIQGKMCKELPFFDYIGAEIETFGDNVPRLDFINTTSDSSIDADFGHSVEVVTLPASADKFVENIKTLTKELRQNGFGVNKSCGLHIHIDCRKIKEKPQKISNLMSTYYAFEDILFSMLPKSRWNNTYCKPLFTDYVKSDFVNKKIDKLNQKWYKSSFAMKRDRYDHSRYHAFNAHSIFYRGTLEVRMHSGTLDSDKIINWVYVLLKMKQWALNNYDDKIIRKALSTSSSKAKYNLFIKTFKFNNNKKIKTYIDERITKFNPLIFTNKQNYWTLRKEDIKLRQTSDRLYQIQNALVNKFYDALQKKINSGKKLSIQEKRLSQTDEYDCKQQITHLIKHNVHYKRVVTRRGKIIKQQEHVYKTIEKYYGRGVEE